VPRNEKAPTPPKSWKSPERAVLQPAPEESAPAEPVPVLKRVAGWLGERCLKRHSQHGDDTVEIAPEHLVETMEHLRGDPDLAFDMLIDLAGLDGLNLGWKKRFRVVCHLYSTTRNHRLRVKVRIDGEDPVAPTLSGLWPGAEWYEREVWDMFGIRFEGHPDLRRILLYEEFEGHPLRKDYPIDKRQPLIGSNPQASSWRAGSWPSGIGAGPLDPADVAAATHPGVGGKSKPPKNRG